MGIIRQAADAFDQSLTNFKDLTPGSTRAQRRKYVAALVTRGQEWLARFDAQENAAPADFAASKKAQFNTFVNALPEPVLDAAPATDPVP